MILKFSTDSARISGLVLAKVGNPSRDEPLQTSKRVLQVDDADQAVLTSIFLRPFRNLLGQRFHHHASLEKHELNQSAAAIFKDPATLLDHAATIATRLHTKSTHPNIKSGDLCIALLEGLQIDEQPRRAICILKSESVMPFLSISDRDGDLALSTEHGINPEKIDKGCLILEHFPHKGFYVVTFDRGSSESRFWIRDFLGVVPIPDESLLSRRVAEIAVAAVAPAAPATDEPSATASAEKPWQATEAARDALSYFDDRKRFSLAEFEEQALRTPEAKARFAEERRRLEEEEGVKIDDEFDISKRDATKARKLMKSLMKLDTGVEIRLRPKVVATPEKVLEQGYDEERGMKFIKVFYQKDLA